MSLNISKRIREHLNKDNPHHAYLIEGKREEILPEILDFCESLDIKTSANPDFCNILINNFKIDEALDLRAMSMNKSFSSAKKVFIICANTFSIDAENVLLKMFEEPIENTLFFLITPDANALLKTLVSRFYFISTKQNLAKEMKDAEKFIAMPLKNRIDFIKELLAEPEGEDIEEVISLDSVRSKALNFLNALELVLHRGFLKNSAEVTYFSHFFKVREFLRMPGSSTKTLMESIAIVIPNL